MKKTIFLKMLFDAVFQIDDHIILEQKKSIHGTERLYHEHKKKHRIPVLLFMMRMLKISIFITVISIHAPADLFL